MARQAVVDDEAGRARRALVDRKQHVPSTRGGVPRAPRRSLSTSSSARASRSSGSVPRTATQCRPASLADAHARLGVLERDRPRRVDAEPLDGEEVSLGMRLAVLHVVGGDDRAQLTRDPRSRHDRLDLGPERPGHDRHRHARGRVADGLPHAGGHGRAARRQRGVGVDPLLDEHREQRAVDTEPRADDRLLRVPGEVGRRTPPRGADVRGARRAPGRSRAAAARRPRASR